MTVALCELCDRPVDGTAYACKACADRARAQLRDVADAVPAARAVAAGQARHGPAFVGSGGSRLPLDLGAQSRLDAAANALTTWARHVGGTRGIAIGEAPMAGPPCPAIWPACPHGSCQVIRTPPDPLVVAATWLAGHLDWLRHRKEAREAFADIAAAKRVLVALADGPVEHRWLGQCGADTDAGRCPADLHARPGATATTCRECGTRHVVADRRHWLDDVARGYSYTAGEIEQAYPGIRAGTIRVWAHRGRIVATGEVDGRPVYPLGQVLDLAATEAARRAEAQARRARRAQEYAAGTLTDGPTDPEGRAA